MYLGNFSTGPVFYKLLHQMENSYDNKRANWTHKLKMIIHDRIVAFEKVPKIRRKYMATVYESDITDLVNPHSLFQGLEVTSYPKPIRGQLFLIVSQGRAPEIENSPTTYLRMKITFYF